MLERRKQFIGEDLEDSNKAVEDAYQGAEQVRKADVSLRRRHFPVRIFEKFA